MKVARERIDSTLPLDESAMTDGARQARRSRASRSACWSKAGWFRPGTLLTDAKRRWSATVRADGSIACGAHAGSIHKVGAALQGAPSCNGWTFWHVDEGGALTPLDALRQQHLAAL